jgi:hypothetical protein
VIAVLLLEILWRSYRAGALSEHTMQSAAFTTFLFGRMIGCAAEVEITSSAAATWIPARPPRSTTSWAEPHS